MSHSGPSRTLYLPSEDELIWKLHPNYDALKRELPHRTRRSLQARASRIQASSNQNLWTGADRKKLANLRRQGVSVGDLAKLFGVKCRSIQWQITCLGIGKPQKMRLDGVDPTMSSIRLRAVALKTSIKQLNRSLGTKSLFGARHHKTPLKHVVRAIDSLGGTLSIEWADLH